MRNLDGYSVEIVVRAHDGLYTLVATTSRDGEATREWSPPFDGAFDTFDEAERRGAYILQGISQVGLDGKPYFTVG